MLRRRQIDLVDRDHDLHVRGRFGVIDRFDRLRHEAVVRRHHQHDNVSDMRTARTHRGKRGVTRRIEKCNTGAFVIDRVSADVLGDAACFARGHARLADRIHERRLAVVDVTHESDDRPARLEFFFFRRPGGGGATTCSTTL